MFVGMLLRESVRNFNSEFESLRYCKIFESSSHRVKKVLRWSYLEHA